MFANSLRARLTLWYTGVLALVLVSFAAVSYFAIVRSTERAGDESLRNVAVVLRSAILEESAVDEEDEEDKDDHDAGAALAADGEVAEVLNALRFGDFRFAVFDRARQLVASSDAAGAVLGGAPMEHIAELIAVADLPNGALTTLRVAGVETRVFAVQETTDQGAYTVVVARSLEDQARQLAEVQRAYAVAIPFALLLAALGGTVVARKSLNPVVRMGEQAEKIQASNLHERLRVANDRDEIGRLARVFNALLARLESSFEQQRRFMADASHELRTPVAIVRGEAEVALSRADRDAGDYLGSLAIIHDEGKRLTTIVEDLFLLARADAGQRPLLLEEFYLDEVVADSVRAVRSLAHRRGVEVSHEPSKEMLFKGDEALLRRMLLNLLDNAIKYTQSGGKVRVRAQERGAGYVVTVADTGIGIPAEAQPLVFERFFRADKARSRTGAEEGAGAGLGLSIARWIAEAHGGRVELLHSGEHGSTFAVTLPNMNGGEVRKQS
jgi:heavy metal sensor kinase